MKTKQSLMTSRRFVQEILHFIHYLRAKGFSITTDEMITTFRALERLQLSDEGEIFFGLRTILCSTRLERDQFEQLFTAFFHGLQSERGLQSIGDSKRDKGEEQTEQQTDEKETSTSEVRTADETLSEKSEQIMATEGKDEHEDVSFLQAVRQSQRAAKRAETITISKENDGEMLKAVRSFIRSVQLKRSRRWKPQHNGKRIDLRRTFRRNISLGGYAIDPAKIDRQKTKTRFILLCDGSRSMASYTPLFLQFASALHHETTHMELFLFSTDVKKVTHLLAKEDPSHMPTLTNLRSEWGGGTRIGPALVKVTQDNRLQIMSKHTVFMIFSDGLESGDLTALDQGLYTLKQHVNRIIWLNPLLGKKGYQPIARGMKLALQYIDVFAEAHHIKSFHKLAQHMHKYPYDQDHFRLGGE